MPYICDDSIRRGAGAARGKRIFRRGVGSPDLFLECVNDWNVARNADPGLSDNKPYVK